MQFTTYFVVICVLIFSITPGLCRKLKKNNEETEAQLLKKIRKLAKEAGHPDPKNIGKDRDNNPEICYSRRCLESSIQLLEAVNFTADPCDKSGFASFSCHRRIHRDPESFHQSKYGNMSLISWILGVKNKNFTSEILEEPIKHRDRGGESSRALVNAKIIYRQCPDLENARHGTKALWELSKRYGSWSLFTQKEPINFKWEAFAAFLAQMSSKTLLFDVSPVITEDGLELSLDKGQIASRDFNSHEFKVRLLLMLKRVQEHWDETGADFELPESFEVGVTKTFEALTKLQSYTLTFSSRAKSRITIAELNSFTHHRISWLTFFQTAYNATNIEIDEDTYVHVNKKYVETLTKLWYSAGMWESSLLQYELFAKLYPITSLRFSQNATELLKSGNSTIISLIKNLRALACKEEAVTLFGAALSKEFLKRHPYPPHVKKDVEGITDNVLSGLKEYVNESSFLYSSAKDRLRKKYSKVKKILGYPEWLDDKENFTRYYSKLANFQQKDTGYFSNAIKLIVWNEGVSREGLAPTDDNLHYWELNKYIVDIGGASYLALSNAIRIPSPTTTAPIYSFGAPGYINYGGLGSVLGHELGHAMDPEGIFYDRNGNYKKTGLLGAGDQEKYNEWITSVKADYNNSKVHYHGKPEDIGYKSPSSAKKSPAAIKLGATDRSDRTIQDDVADIIGVQGAFNAYKKYLKGREGNGDIKLPGLDHIEDERLFFVAYSNMWCAEMTESSAKYLWAFSHSPDYNRATVPLKRSKQFAETFKCEHNGVFEI